MKMYLCRHRASGKFVHIFMRPMIIICSFWLGRSRLAINLSEIANESCVFRHILPLTHLFLSQLVSAANVHFDFRFDRCGAGQWDVAWRCVAHSNNKSETLKIRCAVVRIRSRFGLGFGFSLGTQLTPLNYLRFEQFSYRISISAN